jgi:tripartite-type tricarboxylate transporter receptor subunit TctC
MNPARWRAVRPVALLSLMITAGAALAQAPAPAAVQNWPAKPVRFFLSNSAGSAPDLVARATAEQLQKATGQSWIVENRPGGEGVIGAAAVARAAPDGYSFYQASIVAIAVQPHMLKDLPYDTLRDFAPVAMIVDSGPSGIAVHPSVAAKTFPEFIALAKSQPGKLSYSVTVAFLSASARWMNQLAGINMTEVYYKETGNATNDALSGQVPVMFNSLGTSVPHIKSGKLRLLAVTSLKRLPQFPEVPTVAEFYPGYESEGWASMAAPAGTPAEIVNRLNREIDRIVKDPQFNAGIAKFYWANLNGASTPQVLATFYRSERDKWGKILKDVGIQPQ